MEFALDNNGSRLSAYDAIKGNSYFCPCCKKELILKTGSINSWHFAHKDNECTDTWHYDMSEWHKRMQSFFPPECREIVIKSNGKTHRADILKDGVVVEFQHSPISADEFYDRNDFYTKAGYRVAWVFDVSQQWESEAISQHGKNEFIFRWKNPLRVLRGGPVPQCDKKISICLCQTIEEDEISDWIYRINWSATDDWGDPTYKYISMNMYCNIDICESMDMNLFFLKPKERMKYEAVKFKPYKTKVRGRIKGLPKETYCCPITKKFIERKTCRYCAHCALEGELPNAIGQRITQFCCCYPRVVNTKVDKNFRDISLIENNSEYKEVPYIAI